MKSNGVEKKQYDGFARRARMRVCVLAVLIVLLSASVILSACRGQFPIAPHDVLRGFLAGWGLASPPESNVAYVTLWQIRFPRIVLGILVGAGLAVAGAVMQAVFSNPLAEPGIIGVSSGAAVGASTMMVLAPSALAGFGVPLGAFASGLATALLVYILSRSGGRVDVISLVLTGIAVTAVCGALTSIATFVAPTTARDQIVFWQMGSLVGATWPHVGTVAAVMAIAITGAWAMSRKLDTLALGENAAEHIGVHVQRIRLWAIVCASMLTAGAVAYAGVIGFVGLIVPHLIRLLVGPHNRVLIPLSALAGAVLITFADCVARSLIPYADLPIGIFTAFVGGPVFFVLLRARLRAGRIA